VKSVYFEKISLNKCEPPIWARTGHLQTVFGHIIPSPELKSEGKRVELELSGGDKVVAYLHEGNSDVVVYLFHGLGGFSHAAYMQRSALLAQKYGHTTFMYNHRGCGEGVGLAKEPYHSGRAEDLSAMVAYGRKLFPSKVHLAIGFSLSANALLLLAANQRANVQPDAAIAVNAPINLGRAGELLQTGFNRVYDLRFMIDMRKALESRHHHEPKLKEISFRLLATMMEFDDLYTAPFGGFKNRDDYYKTCSAARYLPEISIPTVVLTAEDDPFVDITDYKNAKYSAKCLVHIEKHGGHMGYLAKKGSLPPKITPTNRWLDYALDSYINSLRY
jgi:uncharacterized protein